MGECESLSCSRTDEPETFDSLGLSQRRNYTRLLYSEKKEIETVELKPRKNSPQELRVVFILSGM